MWWQRRTFLWELRKNEQTRQQLSDAKRIPVLIINFNQLHYLKNLVGFLLSRNIERIVIIDNFSSYPPLLEYYREIEKLPQVTIERMKENHGHRVFFESADLQSRYGQGFYVLTDADINFYDSTPPDFMDRLLFYLLKYYRSVTKVGFALNLNDIPDHYSQKQKVLNWEQRFWQSEVEMHLFDAPIDTTFALYLPGYPSRNSQNGFYKALRLGGHYTVKHGGWYHDSQRNSEEHDYYLKTANQSFSWKTDEQGNIDSQLKDRY